MALNRIEAGAIIIAGSGMCNGGRIRHHLKHNVWRKNCHVIIAGYQAMGTPGRALVDGASTWYMGDEKIAIRASIHTVGGFSAHADQSQLLEWVEGFNKRQPRLYLIHGEPKAKSALHAVLSRQGWNAHVPAHGETVTI